MAFDLLRRLFSGATHPDLSSPEKRTTPSDQIAITEPYSMALQSINDGFFRALFPAPPSSEPLTSETLQAIDRVKLSLSGAPQATRIPRLPAVIPKLMRSLRDPSSSAVDYVSIINKDPAMSAAVLKLANTVYFTPAHKRINAIDTAVVKLGIEGLRSVLSAAVMQPVIQRDSPYFPQFGEQLWQHSLQCAVACERITQLRGGEPYMGYLLGLIHDIGTIMAFGELCRELKDTGVKETPGFDVFAPFLQRHGALLSERIARQWELPEALCKALQQQIGIRSGDHVGTYGHTLYQANLIGEVMTAAEFHPPKAVNKLLRALELPETLYLELKSLSVEV
ncbi:MAG: HDOD domain-containing protein [Cellvibrionaceae bacterium]